MTWRWVHSPQSGYNPSSFFGYPFPNHILPDFWHPFILDWLQDREKFTTMPHPWARSSGGYSENSSERPARRPRKTTMKRLWRWQYIVLPDILLLLLLLVAAVLMDKYGYLYHWRTREIPMIRSPSSGTWVGPVELSWPRKKFIVATRTMTIFIPLISTLTILMMQIFVRSLWDANAAIFGLLKGIAIM